MLHGTPPFVVFYKTQRNREPAKELVQTLSSSRGEITMQPETSGDYTYTFTALSDRNYRKIPLNGPSIKQVVHPLASAEFVRSHRSGGKAVVNSCSGKMVDVELDLRVSSCLPLSRMHD
jgi:nucleoporin POM152